MNEIVIKNFDSIPRNYKLFPFLIILLFIGFLMLNGVNNPQEYVMIQKDLFLIINKELSNFPVLINNFTQLGDAFIILSLFTVFLLKIPKIWDVLLVGSLITLLVTFVLKSIFKIPRPAAILDTNSFVIIGKTLTAHNSLPSGHSITIFTTFTILMFAFMPSQNFKRFFWIIGIMGMGLFIAFSRVGVGAHYPLDVVFGGLIGYLCALFGIFTCEKFSLFYKICKKKFYPIFILIFLFFLILDILKINEMNLWIYYLSMFSLVVTIYLMTQEYVQKKS